MPRFWFCDALRSEQEVEHLLRFTLLARFKRREVLQLRFLSPIERAFRRSGRFWSVSTTFVLVGTFAKPALPSFAP